MRYAVIALCLLVVGCGELPNDKCYRYQIEAANLAYTVGFDRGCEAALALVSGNSEKADSIAQISGRILMAREKGEPIDTGLMFTH